MAVVASSTPSMEVTRQLEVDGARTIGNPEIQLSKEPVTIPVPERPRRLPFLNQLLSNRPQHQEPVPERPRRLPFLDQLLSNRPQHQDATSPMGSRGRRLLPFTNELLAGRNRRRSSRQHHADLVSTPNSLSSPNTEPTQAAQDCIKKGNLLKKSRARMKGEESEPLKQRRFRLGYEQRWFRLTAEALEYYQQFNHVKVRRSYPLTSIEEIVYNNVEESKVFHLLFSKYEMVLEAETKEEAMDWVAKLKDAWSQWNIDVDIICDDLEPSNTSSPQKEPRNMLALPTPPKTASRATSQPAENDSETGANVTRGRSKSVPYRILRRDSSQFADEDATLKRRNAFKLPISVPHLAPRLKSNEETTSRQRVGSVNQPRPTLQDTRMKVSDPESKAVLECLHKDSVMVKYPQNVLGIPHERVFQVDKDNLQILWKSNDTSKFNQKRSLSLHRVVEVREGQWTDAFDKFPYDEVKNQSFSLIFEEETKKFVRLTSIDLICDHPDNYDYWINGLRSLVEGTKCSIYPQRYQTTDPVVLWLKQLWTRKASHHELNLKDSIRLVLKMQPNLARNHACELIKAAHAHQFRHTLTHGIALRWDGFILMFNLLCCGTTSGLFNIFTKYCVKYPELGMTTEEFRTFLVSDCHWDPEKANDASLQTLIYHHDFQHRAFKKLVAKNRPLQYQICTKLLSYAGFLSFLRSRDNTAINIEHESVYQDMTQPLSHYFINSSHNTYLEADQLKGKSSLEAYIRALLQGCRCVEIDCWDGSYNIKGLPKNEPVIYHGFTLTSKIPFREVIHTINDYAFRTSIYPVIISIENHCSGLQQSTMAKIFRAIMGEVLITSNLVEMEGRERMPSPQDLQGKIILKGSYKTQTQSKGRGRYNRSDTECSITTQQSIETSSRSTVFRSISIASSNSDTETESPKVLVRDASLPDEPISPSPPLDDTYPRTRTRSTSFSFRRGTTTSQSLRDRVAKNEQGQDDQELVFAETSEDLKKLIVYCRAVSIKPWSWNKQQETSVSDMFSFGEPSAVKRCSKYPQELLRCTERQLVRTYPKGTRFDSSNYDPIQMWNCGVQMVALNYQKPDTFMHLNQGFFRRNGGCGYILKPAVMRKTDPGGILGSSTPYTPSMQIEHPDVPSVQFEIELISGQRLCPWNKKCGNVTVDIQTYGLPHDTAKMTQAESADCFWPQWNEGEFKLAKTVIMPELCLVYFRVEIDGKKLMGQNCIPLVSLQPGIKYIPLRTTGGELIPESGLFVRIKRTQGTWQASKSHKYATKKASQTGKEGLDTIQELDDDIDVTASINPKLLKKFLPRQTGIDEPQMADHDHEEENGRSYDFSVAKRTMSTPLSFFEERTTLSNKKSVSQDIVVEVEIGVESDQDLADTSVLSASTNRSVTIQPNADTSSSAQQNDDSQEVTSSENLKEYTLTLQVES